MEAKKPLYIRKSDYINYFLRPKDQWFYKEEDLADYIKSKTKFGSHTDVFLDDLDLESESDNLEMLRLKKINGETIDERDPKVYEGLLIDKKSRDFIALKYIRLKFFDFDKLYEGIKDVNYLANETKTFLLKDNFILFQPVFISKNNAITRPDALIKEKGKYTIIEIKGTSKPKAKHLVDLIYQAHVVNDVLGEYRARIDEYLLCVIKYTKGSKNKLDFEMTNHIPLVKNGKDWNEKTKKLFTGQLKYSDEAIEVRRLTRLDSDSKVTIKSLIEGQPFDLKNKEIKVYELHVKPLVSRSHFNSIVQELHEHTSNNLPSLVPDYEHFKNWFGEYSLLKELLAYYRTNNQFLSFHWSGKLIPFSLQNEAYITHNTQDNSALQRYFLSTKPQLARFFKDFKNINYRNFKEGIYRFQQTKELFAKLKPNKVYFDFETINPAIRVIDDTVPYTQIVIQVSIIKNDKIVNIVKDPLTITVEDFKDIIDNIFNDSDNSYVVYNKSFECSRLNEMAVLINDPEYTKKIEIIINNIFDLCDFFNPYNDLITIQELKGYYSIKNILSVIQENANHIFGMVQALDYHTLDIQNGSEAMNKTIRRFFGLINDDEWKEITEQLKIYCENDVRAMVAVELYIKHILTL